MTSPRPQTRCSVEAGHHAVERPNDRERSLRSYAFDILVSDGEDLHRLPLSMRKASLARLLARRMDGISHSDFEQGEIGPDPFRHACLLGTRGHGFQSPRQHLPRRPVLSLGQGQEPGAPGVVGVQDRF